MGVLTLLAVAFLALAGCRNRTAAQASRNPGASSSASGGAAPRIVSTVPAATAMLVQIGAGADLVGVSRFDRPFLPAHLRTLPVVGDYLHMNVETLLMLRPTALIVQAAARRLEPGLLRLARRRHILVVNLRLNSLHDLFVTARRLGKISGHEAQAKRKIAALRAALRAIAQKYIHAPQPRVAYFVSRQPLIAVGKKTFLAQEIRLAGAHNAAAILGAGYPTTDAETLEQIAPQALLLADPGGAAQRPHDARLRFFRRISIPATRNHQLFLLTGARTELPTLALAKNVARIARLVHPASAAGQPNPMARP